MSGRIGSKKRAPGAWFLLEVGSVNGMRSPLRAAPRQRRRAEPRTSSPPAAIRAESGPHRTFSPRRTGVASARLRSITARGPPPDDARRRARRCPRLPAPIPAGRVRGAARAQARRAGVPAMAVHPARARSRMEFPPCGIDLRRAMSSWSSMRSRSSPVAGARRPRGRWSCSRARREERPCARRCRPEPLTWRRRRAGAIGPRRRRFPTRRAPAPAGPVRRPRRRRVLSRRRSADDRSPRRMVGAAPRRRGTSRRWSPPRRAARAPRRCRRRRGSRCPRRR